MRNRFAPLLLLCLTLLGLTGCASLSRVRFTVEPSSLDYVQFRCTRPAANSATPVVVRLELAGSGYLEYRSGRSTRVGDNFWQEPNSPTWEDFRADHIVIPQQEAVAIYQRLVDAGVFDLKQKKDDSPGDVTLAVLASIGFEKRLLLTNYPVYLQIFGELLGHFE